MERIMIIRIKRIIKSYIYELLNWAEDPIKIMNQIIGDSKKKMYEIYIELQKIRISIKSLKSNQAKLEDGEIREKITIEIKRLEKLEQELIDKINIYKVKVLEYDGKITLLKAKYNSNKILLKVRQDTSKFNPESDTSTLDRMESKISEQEAKLEALKECEIIFSD